MNIAVWVGGRANYGRLYSVIMELMHVPDINVKIYGAKIPYSAFDIEEVEIAETLSKSMYGVMRVMDNHFYYQKPDIALVHGDRADTCGFGLAAAFHEIPLIQLEAGDTTEGIDQKMRYLLSSVADYLVAFTPKSFYNLGRFNKNKTLIGSPVFDTINTYWIKEYPKKRDTCLILFNPDPEPLNQTFESIVYKIRQNGLIPVWICPNGDNGSNAIKQRAEESGAVVRKTLPLVEYLELVYNSVIVIGNTSSGIREACMLDTPFLPIGKRQSERETGGNIIKATEIDWGNLKKLKPVPYKNEFGGVGSAKKIVEYIYETVWQNALGGK